MEGINTLKSLLQKGDWLVKIDLKDAYFSVPVSQEHRRFLCFQVEEKLYQFTCLPFSLASAPWVFTKTLKPIAALDRCQHRRHSPHGRVSGESERPGIRVHTPSTMPGLYDKSRENHPGTNTVLGVPGFHSKHSIDGADTPTKEIKKDKGGVPKNVRRGRASVSPCPLQTDWQDECHQSGNPTCSSVLQEPPNGPHGRPETGGSGLQDDLLSFPPQQRGADMVGRPDSRVEWQVNALDRARVCHRVGRLEPGLGSVLPGHQYRGPVVSPGEGMAHQLLGITSSNPRPENLREGKEECIGITEDRQYDCSCVHQQPGGGRYPRSWSP